MIIGLLSGAPGGSALRGSVINDAGALVSFLSGGGSTENPTRRRMSVVVAGLPPRRTGEHSSPRGDRCGPGAGRGWGNGNSENICCAVTAGALSSLSAPARRARAAAKRSASYQETHVEMNAETQEHNVTMIAKKKQVHQDRAEVLGLLQRALNLRPVEGGAYRPDFNPSALLVLADRLADRFTDDPHRVALAAVLRGLADTRFVEVPSCGGDDWQPVASGPFWNVAVKCVYPGSYQVRRQLYYGTKARSDILFCWERAAWEYQRDYRHTAGAPDAHPDVPTPEGVLSVPKHEDIRPAFERLRFELAAALVGFTPWHVVARDLLLSWGDFAATHCLARYHPPRKVVRELRQSDPKKYARVNLEARDLA